MSKNIILTSRQNYVWHSMQEIIPFLNKSWQSTDLLFADQLTRLVNVDETPLDDYFTDLLDAENLILTCFTPKIFKLVDQIRNHFGRSPRLIVHLHNQASLTCWPMRRWGSSRIFRTDDVFISSCERDKACFQISYPEAKIEVVPFSYLNISIQEKIVRSAKTDKSNFLYIGRISSQKNLHTLFLSLFHFKKRNPKLNWNLEIIGKEDGMGSPNMGQRDQNYRAYLEDLSQELDLQSHISFSGFLDRTQILEILKSRLNIFITPSLHSDENFGMAAFQSLCLGQPCVLTDWGGHTDFYRLFPDLVKLVPVYKSKFGPFLNPLELAVCLEKSVMDTQNQELESDAVPTYYHSDSIIQKFGKILTQKRPRENPKLLSASPWVNEIDAKLTAIQKFDDTPQIFDSYADRYALKLLEAYGMQKIPSKKRDDAGNLKVPWIQFKEKSVSVKDPHRGNFEFDFTNAKKAELDQLLYEAGWIYQDKATSTSN